MIMNYHYLIITLLLLHKHIFTGDALGFGCNLGTQTSHLLPPDIIVKLMKDNGFYKVKLFEAHPGILEALGGTAIDVMVGIPNNMLPTLASDGKVAEDWVSKNISYYMSKHVNIRFVAVGNEPLLTSYNGTNNKLLLPALRNVYSALDTAGLADIVKITIPHNADVYQTSTGKPSGGDFRSDILDIMVSTVAFLKHTGGVITVNVYPFMSLRNDPSFPTEYAFFDSRAPKSSGVVDDTVTYTNAMDANYDTLVAALERHGAPSLPIIIGEVGWPTDGDRLANASMARRFYQGLIKRVVSNQGWRTARRPGLSADVYMFSLLDEDSKSTDPGTFEHHWGIFYMDGSVKYPLDLWSGRRLTGAKGVKHLERQWCVAAQGLDAADPRLKTAAESACREADCTCLAPGSSCAGLDPKDNATYAFNSYYQVRDQQKEACENKFAGLAEVTTSYPTSLKNSCRLNVMIARDAGGGGGHNAGDGGMASRGTSGGSSLKEGWTVVWASVMLFPCLLVDGELLYLCYSVCCSPLNQNS